jgi:DNA primase catalytic core
MVKISKPLSAGKVSDYYKVEYSAADQRYFREGEKQLIGEWHGKLAEHFGLGSGVDPVHYDRMAEGHHPLTGEVLIKARLAGDPRTWIKQDADWKTHIEELFVKQGVDKHVLREVPASEYRVSPPRPVAGFGEVLAPRTEREATLIQVHDVAAKFYSDRLAAAGGETARQYLETERGITETTWQEAGVGYAPKGDVLWAALQPQFSEELLAASGLFARDRQGNIHDRFQDRIMFPITDRAGETIAFGGRCLSDENTLAPKYLNSRETEIYKKSEVLYGFHEAAMEQSGRLVVQEGYLDVLASRQAGIRDVVSLSGTALSEDQARQIRSVASDVVLNLDLDGPGQKASDASLDTLLEAGVRVRGVSVPDDAAAFARAEGGEALKEKVDQPRPLVEWLAERARGKWNLEESRDPQERAEAVRWVSGKVEKVPAEQRERMSAELARYLKVEVEEADLKPKFREHVAAWDMTFAPNKSYSVAALVGGDSRIVEWHQASVREALDEGEKYAQARIGGASPAQTTENWASALFMHDVARPVDGATPNPHLHTHAVMFNMTLADEGGRVRSMNPAEIFLVQSYTSSVYQASMANHALAGGYKLEHGRNFSTRIKGFSDEYLEAMSARTEAIETEKAAAGLVGAEADELVNKRLREPKQVWEAEALHAEHRRQAEEMGQKPWEVACEALGSAGVRIAPQERREIANKAITYARDRLQEGQAVNDHFELMRDALRSGMGRIRVQDVKEAFDERVADQKGEFVRVDHYRENAPGWRYTTKNMRQYETQLIERVLAGIDAAEPIAQVTRDEFRDRYKNQVGTNGKKFELNDGQLWTGYRAVTESHQFVIVKGAAGVGKSESFRIIAEIARNEGLDVRGVAPTGGASNNLRKEGIDSSTVQAHINRTVDPQAKRRLYLFDEGSLAGTRQVHKFMSLVRPQDRVIFAYDPRQHQSVEAGRIVEELERAGLPTYRLEKIERQRESPELLEVVNKFKNGDMISGLQDYQEQGRIREEPNRDKRIKGLANWYALNEDIILTAPDNRTITDLNVAAREALRHQGKLGTEDEAIIGIFTNVRDLREVDRQEARMYERGNTVRWIKAVKDLGVKAGTYAKVLSVDAEANLVTVEVKDRLGKRELTYDPKRYFGVEIFNAAELPIAEGERLQLTRPWRVGRETIPNRSMAIVEGIGEDGKATLVFQDGKRMAWDPKQNPHVDYAYAVTSYSVQFATAQKVAIHLDTGDSKIWQLLDKPFLYVSTTRGKSDVRIFTDDAERLLDPVNSPVQRMALKPTALSPKERAAISVSAAYL